MTDYQQVSETFAELAHFADLLDAIRTADGKAHGELARQMIYQAAYGDTPAARLVAYQRASYARIGSRSLSQWVLSTNPGASPNSVPSPAQITKALEAATA